MKKNPDRQLLSENQSAIISTQLGLRSRLESGDQFDQSKDDKVRIRRNFLIRHTSSTDHPHARPNG